MNTDRPIGYWLKHLDRLIEASFDRALTESGLTRRHWQTMNLLRAAPRDTATLTEALRPFWDTGAVPLDAATNDLAGRGWLTEDDTGRYLLTPAGRAAHAAIETRVQALRATARTGLTEDDYRTTVRVLRQMADNLERTAYSSATASR